MKKIILSMSLVAVSLMASDCKVNLTTSAYVNWNAINASQKAGLYQDVEKKFDCKLNIVYYPDYLQSLDYFKAGKADAVTVTNLDQMTAISARPSVAVVLQDYSAGNDGLISRHGKTLNDLKGKDIWMVTKSISEQLFIEVAKKGGLDPYKDFKIKHMDADSNLRAAYDAGKIDNIVTWNPALEYLVQKTDTKKVIDSSKNYPGLIVDMLVLGKDVSDFDKKSAFLRACWDKTASVIHSGRGNDYNGFMVAIADDMGSSIGEAKTMINGSKIFTPDEEVKFFSGMPVLEKTAYDMAKDYEFLMEPVGYDISGTVGGDVKPTVFFDIK
jgi:NitT/TauT family transport system substrate-binding protein